MKERVDPLIEERAPWLYRPGGHIRFVRGLLHLMLGYDKTVEIGARLSPMSSAELMDELALMIARNVEAHGIENIPETGPAIVVCNHPTGIADGIIMWSVLAQRRPDLFFFANRDAIRVMPQLEDIIAPVEWRKDKRSHSSNRETLTYAANAFSQDRLGVLFPSGRLAKRKGLRLYERPWMPSAAMLARKYKLPVVPMHIKARNSALFYLFDALHPTLRDITLFHEVINKSRHSFEVRADKPLDGGTLPKGAEAATDMLRRASMRAGVEGNYSVLIPSVPSRAAKARPVFHRV